MSSLVIQNISTLFQINPENASLRKGLEMNNLPSIDYAYVVVKNDRISDFGSMENCPSIEGATIVDASGRFLLPTWCDSHTHIVYAGDRSGEFEDRINGLSYEEIANNGGGILNSALRLADTTEDQLYHEAYARLDEIMEMGTGAVEIKSGYGLSVDSELKMLRVIARLKKNHPITIVSTFLGAHAFPQRYTGNPDGYIDEIIDEMLPKIAEEGLADFIDIFCEKGYFTVDHTHRILEAGVRYGLIPKTHVNQFYSIGGIEASVKHGALSVDHLEVMDESDYAFLENGKTIATVLPTCSFFLSIPYAPAREMISRNIPIALATDFNPGSTPSGNMNLVVSTACIKMKITPQEAINAATINGAYAMKLQDDLGSIAVGKKANLMLTRPMNRIAFLPYYFGVNPIDMVILNGKIVVNKVNK